LHHGIEQFKRSDDYNDLFDISPYAAYHLLRHFTDPVAQHFPDKFQQMINDVPIDSLEDLRKIQCPVLTVVTEEDMVHPVHFGDELNQYIPHHTLMKITPKPQNERLHLKELELTITDFLNSLK
jgi:pimeloyl-ACP methyl ester carboxylesterase